MQTERLLLRQWRDDDVDAYARLVADPGVMRYLADGTPGSRFDAWRAVMTYAGAWRLQGFAHWVVELRETGEFVGRAGPWYPATWPCLEIGWTIDPRHQGRGYATEAGAVALRCAWQYLQPARLVSLVRPGNAPSAAVAVKLGATLRETVDLLGRPAGVYEYTPPP